MAKKDIPAGDVKRLRQVADGVRGSEGEVVLAPRDYETYKTLGGKAPKDADETGPVRVAAADLCACVDKTKETEDEPAVAPADPIAVEVVDKGGKGKTK